MKKIKFYALLGSVLAFFACSENSTTSPNKIEDNTPFGWLEAGFKPDANPNRGGGLQKVTHSGDWIVLMDDWISPVDSNDTLFGDYTHTPRLFISKIGSNQWDTIKPPAKESIKSLYADSANIYTGSYVTGELWKYKIDLKKMGKATPPYALKELEAYNIFGISSFKKKIFISMSGYKNKDIQVYDSIQVLLLFQNDSSWINTTPKKFEDYIKVQFHKGTSLKDNFYTATTYGVWHWSTSSLQWTHLPDFPEPESWSSQIVSDIVIHKENLYTIVSNRIYAFDELTQNWNSIDSLRYEGDTSGYNYRLISNVPYPAKALASDGKHLFVAGGDNVPYVYMGDYGEPYGNIPKAWRRVGSLCKNFHCLPNGGGTTSMDIIGDTFYVANWKNLLKFPLDKLDSAIADKSDYL